jgi:hypothetical protein
MGGRHHVPVDPGGLVVSVGQGFLFGVYTGHLVLLISVFIEDNQLHTYLYTLRLAQVA